MEYNYTSKSVEETMQLAENIESKKFPGMLLCLEGELGSGKTVFVKGLAKSLGIEETITSPTFTLIKEYDEGEMPLSHMDVYRIEGDPTTLGLEDYFNSSAICIIEWANLINNYLPKERLDIKLKLIDENTRLITLIPHGKQYEDLVKSVI